MDVRTTVPTLFGDLIAQCGETWKAQLEALRQKLGDAIEEVRMPLEHATEVPIVYAKRDRVIDVLRFLKEDQGCDYAFLADLTAIDEESEPRFEVVYNLFSITRKARIRVKTRVAENEEQPTATVLWPAADWLEREVFDMFGIRFKGHPNLRRILMDSRWVGHPLRKDYPLRGYQIFPQPEPIDPARLDYFPGPEAHA